MTTLFLAAWCYIGWKHSYIVVSKSLCNQNTSFLKTVLRFFYLLRIACPASLPAASNDFFHPTESTLLRGHLGHPSVSKTPDILPVEDDLHHAHYDRYYFPWFDNHKVKSATLGAGMASPTPTIRTSCVRRRSSTNSHKFSIQLEHFDSIYKSLQIWRNHALAYRSRMLSLYCGGTILHIDSQWSHHRSFKKNTRILFLNFRWIQLPKWNERWNHTVNKKSYHLTYCCFQNLFWHGPNQS